MQTETTGRRAWRAGAGGKSGLARARLTPSGPAPAREFVVSRPHPAPRHDQFALAPLAVQPRGEGASAEEQPADVVAQPPRPRQRHSGVPFEQRLVAVKLPRRDRRPFLAEGQAPDVGRPRRRPVPAEDLAGVVFEQQFQGVGCEAPVVARVFVDVEVERRGDEQRAVGPEHAADFVEAAPEATDVLEGLQRQDRADGGVGLRQRLHVADEVHAGAGPHVEADVGPAGKERSQVRDVFLSFHLIRADFQDRPGQVEGLGHRPHHAAQQRVHGAAFRLPDGRPGDGGPKVARGGAARQRQVGRPIRDGSR